MFDGINFGDFYFLFISFVGGQKLIGVEFVAPSFSGAGLKFSLLLNKLFVMLSIEHCFNLLVTFIDYSKTRQHIIFETVLKILMRYALWMR